MTVPPTATATATGARATNVAQLCQSCKSRSGIECRPSSVDRMSNVVRRSNVKSVVRRSGSRVEWEVDAVYDT